MKTIPFRSDMATAVLGDQKTATRRSTKYGEPYQRLRIKDTRTIICLVKVYRQALGLMTEHDAWAEGCRNLEAFKILWAELHPRAGWNPKTVVWVHEFTYEGQDGEDVNEQDYQR